MGCAATTNQVLQVYIDEEEGAQSAHGVCKARTCLRPCAVKFRFSDFILGTAQV